MQRGLFEPCAIILAISSACGCTSTSTPEPSTPEAAQAPGSARLELVGVATWRGNATAAYSIIHDDICDAGADGAPAIGSAQLKKHALHAGFGVIGSKCLGAESHQNKWPLLKALVAEGNDVFSHSWSHPCIDGELSNRPEECPPDAIYSSDMDVEIGKAGEVLKTQLGVSTDFFIFPYDYCSPRAVSYLKAKGYLGARCGASDGVPANPPAFADPFLTLYDVFGPAYSYYWNDGACKGKIRQFKTAPYDLGAGSKEGFAPAACVSHVLQQYVDDTIASKGLGRTRDARLSPDRRQGWLLRADLGGRLRGAPRLHRGQTRQRRALGGRANARAQVSLCAHRVRNTHDRERKHFAEPNADCRKYATTLSYLLTRPAANDGPALHVEQDGKWRTVKKLAPGRFVADADPTGGDAVLTQ